MHPSPCLKQSTGGKSELIMHQTPCFHSLSEIKLTTLCHSFISGQQGTLEVNNSSQNPRSSYLDIILFT